MCLQASLKLLLLQFHTECFAGPSPHPLVLSKGAWSIHILPDIDLSFHKTFSFCMLDDLTGMGSAMQSSYFIPEMSGREAFDDDRVTCTATKEETNPWWKIDLGSTHNISEVVIYTDDTLPHSSQYDVFVGRFLVH